MAEFNRDNSTIQHVFVRKLLPSGENRYVRQPYNLVTYDDGQTYVEPMNTAGGASPFTFGDSNNPATANTFLIQDLPPFSGITEIR